MFKEKDITLIKDSFISIEQNKSVFIRTFYSRLYDLDADKDKYLKGEIMQKREEIIPLLGKAIANIEAPDKLSSDLKVFGELLHAYGVPTSSYQTIGVAFVDALAAALEYHGLSQEITMAWTKLLKYFFAEMTVD